MARENYNELIAFIAVARECSFTKAAAHLGITQSALSHTVKGLEKRLGIRLLSRTTRNVSLTEAGERLLTRISPKFEEIDTEISLLSELRDKPAGTIRISSSDHAIDTLLWPKLAEVLKQYPDIKLELCVDYGFTDIVARRFDAGVRFGEAISNDMIAIRIGPDLSMAAVATPAYFSQHAKPVVPHDLLQHNCINLRFPTYGGLYAWEFEKGDRQLNVNVDGQLVFNNINQILQATLASFGIAFLPEDIFQPYVDSGELVRVLADWCPPFAGYHLYFPHRMRSSPAFDVIVNALRYHR
ncbi:LysR family transcriptional regulator [Shewanella sp. A3A]|uniref:LysR family transcriptional regulator n=1 Tax=Shewanella electrica TaxID=515560 RepID=A0ABT2FQ21_9GAMM|nr:LysR family transcriptional regulator [Shewanella electrica]MCH1921567.1 LysR family transcriptional regulator [Shewanella ferrihydritica]MCH1926849.1 LysR family transcriptional regulator [Shewanella electrica]MCS4558410.1 LysR family transcriptional regulator [Shewanella electrica]